VQLGGGRSISDACGFYRVKEGLKSPASDQAEIVPGLFVEGDFSKTEVGDQFLDGHNLGGHGGRHLAEIKPGQEKPGDSLRTGDPQQPVGSSCPPMPPFPLSSRH